MKFRKKPVVIDAVQWVGSNLDEIREFAGDFAVSHDKNELSINTAEGMLHASVNDFIIKGVKGEFYPCKPDIFWSTYEKV